MSFMLCALHVACVSFSCFSGCHSCEYVHCPGQARRGAQARRDAGREAHAKLRAAIDAYARLPTWESFLRVQEASEAQSKALQATIAAADAVLAGHAYSESDSDSEETPPSLLAATDDLRGEDLGSGSSELAETPPGSPAVRTDPVGFGVRFSFAL